MGPLPNSMFTGMVVVLMTAGAVVFAALCGVAWFIHWLVQHLHWVG